MKRFKNIDSVIESYALKLNAKLTKDRPEYPEALRRFEERRIDWIENDIMKAIIIQPNFENNGVNQNLWNFINAAWYDDGLSFHSPSWYKDLIKEKDFSIIENSIEDLLSESVKNLKTIQIKDLK
jgi:hypothetical protein